METADREALARFARERHLHYDLAREEVSAGDRSDLAAVEIRLFAAGEGGVEPPGSRRHLELLGDLRSFAERLVRGGEGAAGRAEIVPTTAPPVYSSREAPGGEEVALTLRVRCERPEHRTGNEDRCIGELRRRLDELGVPRR